MRLRPEKIEVLAEQVYAALAANKDSGVSAERAAVTAVIRRVITEDLKAEDEIEEQARALLDEHMSEIQRKGISFEKILLKTKQQLARERKMVL